MSSVINPVWPNLYLSLSIYFTGQDIFRQTEPIGYIHTYVIYVYTHICTYVYMHIYIKREMYMHWDTYYKVWLMLLWNLQSPSLHLHLLSVSWRPRTQRCKFQAEERKQVNQLSQWGRENRLLDVIYSFIWPNNVMF